MLGGGAWTRLDLWELVLCLSVFGYERAGDN